MPTKPDPQPSDLHQEPQRLLQASLPFLMLAGTVGALEFARGRFLQRNLFVPERYPEGEWQPDRQGLPARDHWFTTDDGVELHGWWIPRKGALGTLLYCHGNSGSIGQRVDVLRDMARLRMHIFAFDYRGYGRSQGSPSEQGLFRDVRAAFRYLTGTLGQQAGSVVLFGHSLGGAVAIDGATELPVCGLVVQSSFTDVRQMARYRYPRLPLHLIARNQFRSIEKVGALDMPKLFIHGTGDNTIPHGMGHELFQEAAAPKHFYSVPEADHNDVHELGGAGYRKVLRRFLRRCVAS